MAVECALPAIIDLNRGSIASSMTIPDSDLPDFEDETTDRRLGPLSMLIILILLCSLLMPLLMPLLGEIRSFTPPQPTPTLPLRTALL